MENAKIARYCLMGILIAVLQALYSLWINGASAFWSFKNIVGIVVLTSITTAVIVLNGEDMRKDEQE